MWKKKKKNPPNLLELLPPELWTKTSLPVPTWVQPSPTPYIHWSTSLNWYTYHPNCNFHSVSLQQSVAVISGHIRPILLLNHWNCTAAREELLVDGRERVTRVSQWADYRLELGVASVSLMAHPPNWTGTIVLTRNDARLVWGKAPSEKPTVWMEVLQWNGTLVKQEMSIMNLTWLRTDMQQQKNKQTKCGSVISKSAAEM